jgi:adenosylhomocysteine nucleosidase
MPKIAIVAALDHEVRPVIRGWRHRDAEHGNRRFRFYESGHAVLTCGGIGPEPARRAAEAIMALYQPALIYSAGFAGALAPDLKVADIIVPRCVIDAADGSRIDTGQGDGVLITFPSIASPAQKARLEQSFHAQAVDMEASSVALAAQARGTRFAAVKAISDESNFVFPSLDRFITPDGRFRAQKFILFAVARPWLWRKVFLLARNSGRAAHALAQWLERLPESHPPLFHTHPSVEMMNQP